MRRLHPSDLVWFQEQILRIPRPSNTAPVRLSELEILVSPWRIVGVYGRGVQGIVFGAVSPADSQRAYAMKVIAEQRDPKREFQIQAEFAAYQMSPQIHEIQVREFTHPEGNRRFVYAIMDPIARTLSEYLTDVQTPPKPLLRAFDCLLQKKFLLQHPAPFLHGDMHVSNLVFLEDGKTMGIIDFGNTQNQPASLQVLDAIPLIGSLLECAKRKDNPRAKRLAEHLVTAYNKAYDAQYELDRFVRHPGGGFGYRTDDPHTPYLHCYNWKVNEKCNPLPTVLDLQRIWPTFATPHVTN